MRLQGSTESTNGIFGLGTRLPISNCRMPICRARQYLRSKISFGNCQLEIGNENQSFFSSLILSSTSIFFFFRMISKVEVEAWVRFEKFDIPLADNVLPSIV